VSICDDRCNSDLIERPALKIKNLVISTFRYINLDDNEIEFDHILNSFLVALNAFECQESIRISLNA
jgi:hypothetical protein